MADLNEVIFNFALRRHSDLIGPFRDFCENVATAVTMLIANMERYTSTTRSGDLRCTGEPAIDDAFQILMAAVSKNDVLMPPKCNQTTCWILLSKNLEILQMWLAGIRDENRIVRLPSITWLQEFRRKLWDTSDFLSPYARGRTVAMGLRRSRHESDGGRPMDWPTYKLLGEALAAGATLQELATALVDAKLDAKPSGSTAQRVRRELKRLTERHKRTRMRPFPVGTKPL